MAGTINVLNAAPRSISDASRSINDASRSINDASRSIIYDSRVTLQIVVSIQIIASITIVTYDRNMFMVQATCITVTVSFPLTIRLNKLGCFVDQLWLKGRHLGPVFNC